MKIKMYLMCLLILLSISGCQQSKPPSVLDNNTCDLPCWNEIRLGVTTANEFEAKLNNLEIVQIDSILLNKGKWSIFENQSFFQITNSNIQSTAYFIEEKIVLLDFWGDLDITFEQIMDLVGEPEYIINIPMSVGVPGFPTTSFSVNVIYPTSGILIVYNTRDLEKNKRSVISPDIQIKLLALFDPSIYDQLLEEGLLSQSMLDREETLKYMRDWKGFGDLNEKYPPAILH